MKHRREPSRFRIRVGLIATAATVLVVGGAVSAAALLPEAGTTQTATCTHHPTLSPGFGGSSFQITCTVANPPASTVTSTATTTATATQTATQTATATATATQTASATATATVTNPTTPPTTLPTSASTSSGSWECSVPIGGVCGAYDYPKIPMSNGYNTYVSNQAINVHGTETVNANSPDDWQVVANLNDCGGCVQTFPDVQQLTNNWNGSGWGSGSQDTPLASLSKLQINYSETSPSSGASYEFAPDIWQDNYNSDVMFWVDTQGRCNTGAFGDTVLGHAVLGGQSWTVHRYGGAGAEIIFVLDGADGPGTCAQQASGTVDIKAGLEWLVSNGFESGPIVLSQINTGWEITQADNATFTVHSYSITAN